MGPVDEYTAIDNLEVMEVAVKYQRYLAESVLRVLGRPASEPRVLDFGAGSGTMANALSVEGYSVTCLEPDATLRGLLTAAGHECGDDLAALSRDRLFDVVYTMNVLEHIDDDVGTLRTLADVLRPSGRLVVYVPAFQVLFSSMDEKVGHLRRYRRSGLVDAVRAAGFEIESCRYVDSLGYLASLGYKAIGNRQGDLDERAIALYDRWCFPVSTAVDRVTGRIAGKNLLLYARRP